ncbi:MAG: hypothetical protein ACI4XF_05855 [Oscillospiraceae bacterium]
MVNVDYKKLKLSVIIYTVLPIIFFYVGWLNTAAAIIFTLLILAAAAFSMRRAGSADGEREGISVSKRNLVILAAIAFAWCFFGGQGGFVSQTSDHLIRNKIISDMILKDWPVTYCDGQNMLCYYIAYWTIPTSLGKAVFLISGSEFAGLLTGNITLLLQSFAGVFLTFLLVCVLTCKNSSPRPILAAVMFILFSGLDIIGLILTGQSAGADHYEWWASHFQFSSNTTCLYWVYNQTIPIWPLMLCLINEKKMKDFAFLGLLAFPYGPFPFVGIVLFCLIKAAILLVDGAKEKNMRSEIMSALSLQNIISVFAVAPVFILYFTSNIILNSGNSQGSAVQDEIYTGFRLHNVLTGIVAEGDIFGFLSFLGTHFLFILLEVGIYSILTVIAYKNRERTMIIAVTVLLMMIPFFQIGYSYDFAMRVSIPGLVYICIMMIRLIHDNLPDGRIGDLIGLFRKNRFLAAACLVMFFGSLTPIREIQRELFNTIEYAVRSDDGPEYFSGFDYDRIITLEDENQNGNFFAVNYKGSPFYKYLCKK